MEKAFEFRYNVIFEKKDNKLRFISFNSPYKNSDQELDDIHVAFYGKDLQNNDCSSYKIINWESLSEEKKEVIFDIKFIPNEDGTYDQIFKLIEIK